MGVTITTKYAIGDKVMVEKDDAQFLAVIDTVSFMQFKMNRNRIVTDVVYIGVDSFGDRRTFNESECKDTNLQL